MIGAGPVGLAAAAHLLARGLEPLVFEAGAAVGASVREWGHVRVFSPWEFNVDPVAAELLERHGWTAPAADGLPDRQRHRRALPRAAGGAPAIAAALHLGARVVGGHARTASTSSRTPAATTRRSSWSSTRTATERRYLARAVIDASGTWTRPNPLGAGGVPAAGERAHADRIAYGIPDVLGAARARYAGKRVLVVGSGHSAFNAILDLVALRDSEPATEIVWAIRGGAPGRKYGGGGDDQLPARGALGAAVRDLVADGVDRAGRRIPDARGARARRPPRARRRRARLAADEVIAATGFRPDLALLGELRLDLDDRVEAARALAPLIDPNLHSCGSVPPHGVDELSHPDAGFYMVGMKSYGRAPTFLLRTGYEQVRSVVAALAGDWEAARQRRARAARDRRLQPHRGRARSRRRGARAAAAGRARARAIAGGVSHRRRSAVPPARRRWRSAGAGGSSARCRSPRPSPRGSSTTRSRRSWSRCSASSASRPRS